MNVLVTGATGFTGSQVVPLLLQRGLAVRCFVRPSSDLSVLPRDAVAFSYGDLRDAQALGAAMQGVDALVNIASLGFGHAAGIVRCAEQAGIKRAVFVSTTAIFTGLNARTKAVRLEAEATVRTSQLAATIIRPTMIYGSARDRNICRLIRYLNRWPVIPVFGSGDHWLQPVFVEDVARAAVAALGCAAAVGRSYNIAGANRITFNELIDTICDLIGKRVMKLHLAPTLFLVPAELLESLGIRLGITAEQIRRLNEDKAFDFAEAARDFGFEPRTFREGVSQELLGLRLVDVECLARRGLSPAKRV
jgi:nucleoside-diphosphate-sugar epimerase